MAESGASFDYNRPNDDCVLPGFDRFLTSSSPALCRRSEGAGCARPGPHIFGPAARARAPPRQAPAMLPCRRLHSVAETLARLKLSAAGSPAARPQLLFGAVSLLLASGAGALSVVRAPSPPRVGARVAATWDSSGNGRSRHGFQRKRAQPARGTSSRDLCRTNPSLKSAHVGATPDSPAVPHFQQ